MKKNRCAVCPCAEDGQKSCSLDGRVQGIAMGHESPLTAWSNNGSYPDCGGGKILFEETR